MKAVLVTTKHRGVFFGYVKDEQDMNAKTMGIEDAKMAIHWVEEIRGVMGLASTGPNNKCRIGAKASIPALHDITAVFAVTEEAEEKWSQV